MGGIRRIFPLTPFKEPSRPAGVVPGAPFEIFGPVGPEDLGSTAPSGAAARRAGNLDQAIRAESGLAFWLSGHLFRLRSPDFEGTPHSPEDPIPTREVLALLRRAIRQNEADPWLVALLDQAASEVERSPAAERPQLFEARPGLIVDSEEPLPVGPSAQPHEPEPDKTFIEIELRDEDGAPISGHRFRLELPDSTVRTGLLPKSGLLSFDPIDPGRSHFSLLPVDQAASAADPTATQAAPAAAGLVSTDATDDDDDQVAAAVATFFEIQYVDEINQPIAGLTVTFHVDGQTTTATTGDDGVARFDGVAAGSCQAEVADGDELRNLVKARWDQVRPGDRLTAADGVTVLVLHDDLEEVQLEKEVRKTVSLQPKVVLARLFGMLFDTDKNFLLPTAIPTIRQLRAFYDDNPASALLVVGHTDTSGRPSYNDPLSLERADAMKAFLTNDVVAWLARFKDSVSSEKRWGATEESLMLDAILAQPAYSGLGPSDDPVLFFQQRHNQLVSNGDQDLGGGDDSDETTDETDTETLTEDGKLGDRTRRTLVRAYMRQDHTTLPASVTLTAHGCGENFPLDDTGSDLDAAPVDDSHEQEDRRVELFFFDGKLGIEPKPPGKNSAPKSPQYPEWRRRSTVVKDLGADVPDSPDQDLILRFTQDATAPLAKRRFRLEVDGVVLVKEGVTGDDGLIQARVRPGSTGGSVTFLGTAADGSDTELWTVKLVFGTLPPASAMKGAQMRLANLGLFPSREDGTQDARSDRALLRLQALFGLTPQLAPNSNQVTLDAATIKQLQDSYGS